VPTIVVIGAGFSGTLTAVHLLRGWSGDPLRAVLLNRSGAMARGVAYGTRSPLHVLNVPAGRMSAFDDDPDDFLRFCRTIDPYVLAIDFVPREWYGRYLEHVLVDAETSAKHAALERVVGEAVAIELTGRQTARVALARGGAIECDRVVLALGNYPPENPAIMNQGFFDSSRYVGDPWRPGALDGIQTNEPILVVGTGLTMLDVVIDLAARGHAGRLRAISRRGLVPQAHRASGASPEQPSLPPRLFAQPRTARHCLREIRRHVEALSRRGVDWRDTMAGLRPVTPALWHALGTTERSRFLRHARPYWDVHRHRAAPVPASMMAEWLASGRLIVQAGRLIDCVERASIVEVEVQPRGASTMERYRVARVINCTGPAGDTRRLRDRLLVNLRGSGLAVADPLGLGLEVTTRGALIDAERHASGILFHVGPFLKARDFEATAVPELRGHAARLAEHLRQSLTKRTVAVRQTLEQRTAA
jgi:uncharacterized NAD(P)/FAD-binding protein YdhS